MLDGGFNGVSNLMIKNITSTDKDRSASQKTYTCSVVSQQTRNFLHLKMYKISLKFSIYTLAGINLK